MRRLKTLWKRLPDWAKAGVNSGWQAGVGSFLLTLLGFVRDVQAWLDDSTASMFPSVSPVGKAGGSLLVAVVTGLLVAAFRKVKPGPRYPAPVIPPPDPPH